MASVPAGSEQVRILGVVLLTPVVLDAGSQTIMARTNYTVVVAPPAQVNAPMRGFLVPRCWLAQVGADSCSLMSDSRAES